MRRLLGPDSDLKQHQLLLMIQSPPLLLLRRHPRPLRPDSALKQQQLVLRVLPLVLW
jgi:hypothetical protein